MFPIRLGERAYETHNLFWALIAEMGHAPTGSDCTTDGLLVQIGVLIGDVDTHTHVQQVLDPSAGQRRASKLRQQVLDSLLHVQIPTGRQDAGQRGSHGFTA